MAFPNMNQNLIPTIQKVCSRKVGKKYMHNAYPQQYVFKEDFACTCMCVYDCRAANFSVKELPEVMGYLRARGVKGYVALNILVSL
jgi:hypothetical protein